MGYMAIAQASIRTILPSVGEPFPDGNITRSPSLTVTAGQSMAGTLYIFTSESAVATTPARNAVVRGNNRSVLYVWGNDKGSVCGTGYDLWYGVYVYFVRRHAENCGDYLFEME
jgi:hypothetical protein